MFGTQSAYFFHSTHASVCIKLIKNLIIFITALWLPIIAGVRFHDGGASKVQNEQRVDQSNEWLVFQISLKAI